MTKAEINGYQNPWRSRYTRWFGPLADRLFEFGFTPNFISVFTFFIGLLSIVTLLERNWVLTTILMTVIAGLDMLDGTIARRHNLITRLGYRLEQILDTVHTVLLYLSFGILDLAPWTLIIATIVLIIVTRTLMYKTQFNPGFARFIAFYLGLVIGFFITTLLVFAWHLLGLAWQLLLLSQKPKKIHG